MHLALINLAQLAPTDNRYLCAGWWNKLGYQLVKQNDHSLQKLRVLSKVLLFIGVGQTKISHNFHFQGFHFVCLLLIFVVVALCM